MSALEKLAVPTPAELEWVPSGVSEVERARHEDPDFRMALAKARARVRQETYKPEVHGPFEAPVLPKRERAEKTIQTEGNLDVQLNELIGRFAEKSPYRYRPRLHTNEPSERYEP